MKDHKLYTKQNEIRVNVITRGLNPEGEECEENKHSHVASCSWQADASPFIFMVLISETTGVFFPN